MVLDYVAIPRQIKEMNRRLMVAADVIFVIRITFLVSVLRCLKYTMVEYIKKSTDTVLSKYLNKVYDIYIRHGFTVDLLLMDCELECLL